MISVRMLSQSVIALTAACALSLPLVAQAGGPGSPAGPDPFTVTINEEGQWTLDGKPLTLGLVNGISTALLPERVVAGDVIFTEPLGPIGGPVGTSDVLRFPDEGNGISTHMQFFSDTPADNLLDLGLPKSFQSNNVSRYEDPSETTIYQAGENRYIVTSDTPVTPEPGSFALLLTGAAPFLGLLKRRFSA